MRAIERLSRQQKVISYLLTAPPWTILIALGSLGTSPMWFRKMRATFQIKIWKWGKALRSARVSPRQMKRQASTKYSELKRCNKTAQKASTWILLCKRTVKLCTLLNWVRIICKCIRIRSGIRKGRAPQNMMRISAAPSLTCSAQCTTHRTNWMVKPSQKTSISPSLNSWETCFSTRRVPKFSKLYSSRVTRKI